MSEAQAASRTTPPAGLQGFLQDGRSFTPLEAPDGEQVQPFPRSPKLQRGGAKDTAPTKEQLQQQLKELQEEKTWTEAHIHSLKKRRADLTGTAEVMKQRVRDQFQNLQRILEQDEHLVLDSVDRDWRQTRTKLDRVLQDWEQHGDTVRKSIAGIHARLGAHGEVSRSELDSDRPVDSKLSAKRPDASERDIRLDAERFEKLLQSLSSICRTLTAALQRRKLLLDLAPVVIDEQTCHPQMTVSVEGRGLSFHSSAPPRPESHLRFDKVCCALGADPLTRGRSYWEVDVSCCSSWAVGVAYASMARKGRNKGAKLGRNRKSWCVERRGESVWAWHNDRHAVCPAAPPPGRVGVLVAYEKGQLTFYDAAAMAVLQRFSAAVTPVFDRAHHQFTEPLYPAVRLLQPTHGTQSWAQHVHFCQGESV